MDNLLLDAIMDLTGAELAFLNGWRYGAPIIEGPITVNDVWNIVPTNPPVSICKLTDGELWRMMEENLENTFSRDPYRQMGGYVKCISGLNIHFKIENPAGNRIQEFFVGGKRLNRRRTYRVCFLTTQGVPLGFGTERSNLDIRAVDASSGYLEKVGQVTPSYRNTVVPI
jgi:sulfur-oxidizing protein SoxB